MNKFCHGFILTATITLMPLCAWTQSPTLKRGAPAIPFQQFEKDYRPPASPEWRTLYRMRIGWAESSEPIQEVERRGYAVYQNRPPEQLAQRVELTQMQPRLHTREKHTDFNLVTRRPDGKRYERDTTIGTAIYCLITSTQENSVEAKLYYHFSGVDSWTQLFGDYYDPILYEKSFMGQITLPIDAWLVIKGEPREVMIDGTNNQRQNYHSYFLIRLTKDHG